MSSELLNVGQAASLLGIARNTFHKLRQRDKSFPAPSFAIGPRFATMAACGRARVG